MLSSSAGQAPLPATSAAEAAISNAANLAAAVGAVSRGVGVLEQVLRHVRRRWGGDLGSITTANTVYAD